MPVWFRAALFIIVVPGAVAGWLPWYFAGRPRLATLELQPHVVAGALLVVIGWAGLLWCTKDFATRGRGTPSPLDPPRALVTNGLYRYVRNPMYVCVTTAIAGQAMMFASRGALIYAAVVLVMFHLRVVIFEEPTLAREFGAEFTTYRANVPRWIPRLG
jgi:protein-S-isoprenylcysteine O-methyltransferase Ste14